MFKIDCTECNLYQNGIQQPYIGSNAKYVIISESPDSSYKLSLSNSKFWKMMNLNGFTKAEFGIIYSINCFNSGRPSEYHRDCCRQWIDKFIASIQPELIICCGNFALHTLTGKWGINKYENKIVDKVLFKRIEKIMYWQNPNTMVYNNSIETSIKKFKCYVSREHNGK